MIEIPFEFRNIGRYFEVPDVELGELTETEVLLTTELSMKRHVEKL